MKRSLLAIVLSFVVWSPLADAVEVAADGRVTFQISAPQANKVELHGQWAKDRIALQRQAGDAWSVTVEAVPAGVWEYNFVVDGLSVLDSSNPHLKPQRRPSRSILHIAGTPLNPWDWRDVPHGTVHQHSYQSKTLGRRREAVVYTPPGYEKSGDTQCPLLVLQHGSGDQFDTWIDHGKAHWILDNLIADGKAVPMIVLHIDGHPHGQLARESTPADREAALTAFERELLDDALPLVETLYRVKAGSNQRALAGLSMGGAQTLGVGLPHADQFGWLGCFSGAIPPGDRMQKALDNPEQLNSQLKLLWIACGEGDFLLPQNHALIATLKDKGVQHEWHETPGDHSWPIWRGYLADFAPRLFQ